MNHTLRNTFLFSFTVLLLIACEKKPPPSDDLSRWIPKASPNTNQQIPEGNYQYQVLGNQTLQRGFQSGQLLSPDSSRAKAMLRRLSERRLTQFDSSHFEDSAERTETTLYFGFPVSLLEKEHLFSAVLTRVSDKDSVSLGALKLSQLPPLHVKPRVFQTQSQHHVLALVGCTSQCTATSAGQPFIRIPVVGVDRENETLIIDIAAIGKSLNLVSIRDPQSTRTRLKTKNSSTVAFDYSNEILAFDVFATMIPISASLNDPNAPTREFTTRWFLKREPFVDPSFESRSPRNDLGFFTTTRSQTAVIERFAVPREDNKIHYYLKNVPSAYRNALSAAFANWNDNFRQIIGQEVFSHEFLEESDPQFNRILAGDLRYNVVEWDESNKAPYNAMGPHTAHQLSGRVLSGHVLIQGPRILQTYRQWFGIPNTLTSRTSSVSQLPQASSVELSVGTLPFRIPAQEEPLREDILDSSRFDPIPSGMSFNEYMHEFFRVLLTHELGHNIGLRHNFKGSLGASDSPNSGEISNSIMDYLGRAHRHLNAVSNYDRASIAYGYAGTIPRENYQYCTDHQVASLNRPTNSAECSRNDATNDPFRFFESRIERALELLTQPGTPRASRWVIQDLLGELFNAVQGMGLYITSANWTSRTWTNFFPSVEERDPGDLIELIRNRFISILCNNVHFQSLIDEKLRLEDKEKTEQNIQNFVALIRNTLVRNRILSTDQLQCPSLSP